MVLLKDATSKCRRKRASDLQKRKTTYMLTPQSNAIGRSSKWVTKIPLSALVLDSTMHQVRLENVEFCTRIVLCHIFFTTKIFMLSSFRTELHIPQMVVHSYKAFIKEASTSPFTIDWYLKMQDTINSNTDAQDHFTLMDKNFEELPTLKDFSSIYEYFYRLHRVRNGSM